MAINILYAIIIVLAFIGLSICGYIHNSKANAKPLVCPLGADCTAVLESRFSKILGVDVQVWGALYYTFIILAYSLLLVAPELISLPSVGYTMLFVTLGAFLFSLYLTAVQGFVIREWCTWCLSSALISVLIFIVAQFASPYTIGTLIKNLSN
jgi:uncharacterized membrane protein